MGRVLGVTAVAVGKLLELLGYRCNKHVTDSAVAVGCGVRRCGMGQDDPRFVKIASMVSNDLAFLDFAQARMGRLR
jgi:hypothetical protein